VNWTLEGSGKGDAWIELDRRERSFELDGELRVASDTEEIAGEFSSSSSIQKGLSIL
jgi:hypothetical protein